MRKFGVRVSEDAPDAPLAQPEEQRKVNSYVTGSNPVERHMHEWRNWKTRRAKDAVPERACEFDSRLVYQKYITGWLTNKAEKEMKTIKNI